MKFRHILLDDSENSYFKDLDPGIETQTFIDGVPTFGVSPNTEATKLFFLDLPPGWQGTWHPSPARQYFVFSSGCLRMQVSETDGEDFTAGDILLMENTTGRGHCAHVVGDESVRGMLVQIE